MELGRCLRLLAPLAILTAVAAASPLAPPGGAGVRTPAGTCGSLGAGAAAGAGAWYQLDARLDASGTLAGMRLTAGTATGARYGVDLPPESFASGPVNGLILVGDDDGARSRLRLLDPVRGCWTLVGTEDAVVRSAVLDAEAALVWEHRVARGSRADLGVWRRALATGRSERALEPIAPDAGYGRTFTTELLSAPGNRLLASSCGARACRTRVLDAVSGHADLVLDTGPVLGMADDRLLAMAACDVLPCGVVAVNVRTGERGVQTADAMAAGLGGSMLVWTDAGGTVWQADLATGSGPSRTIAAAGMVPLRRSSLAMTGAGSAGLVPLAPGGRIGGPGAVRVINAAGQLARPEEVLP